MRNPVESSRHGESAPTSRGATKPRIQIPGATSLALTCLFALLAAAGCASVDSTDATRDPGFLITEAQEIPEPYQPLGFIRVEKFGWYLFAAFPVFSVTLDELVWDLLVAEAKERGADGVINLKYEIFSPSFWRFTVLGAAPIPDWSARGLASGMAIKRLAKKEPAKG